MKDREYYLINQTVWQSIVCDTYTFFIIIAGAAINSLWLGDNLFFKVFFSIMFLAYLISKSSRIVQKFKNSHDLIKHLQDAKAND